MSIEQEFIDQIKSNLKSNGFPEKKVSLPLEKMFEIADSKGLHFNDILTKLKEDKIESNLTDDKIIFTQAPSDIDLSNFNMDSLKDMDQDNLMKTAQELMKNMNPEQMSQIKSMYENMSEDEKENIMNKGKDMGLL
jgi:hypothetical protein